MMLFSFLSGAVGDALPVRVMVVGFCIVGLPGTGIMTGGLESVKANYNRNT